MEFMSYFLTNMSNFQTRKIEEKLKEFDDKFHHNRVCENIMKIYEEASKKDGYKRLGCTCGLDLFRVNHEQGLSTALKEQREEIIKIVKDLQKVSKIEGIGSRALAYRDVHPVLVLHEAQMGFEIALEKIISRCKESGLLDNE